VQKRLRKYCQRKRQGFQEAGVWRKESNGAMFEPEYLNIVCPGCHQQEVYVDCETGFYCMFCGRRFGPGEAQLLIDSSTRRSPEHACGLEARQVADTRSRRWRTTWTHLAHNLGRYFVTGKHPP